MSNGAKTTYEKRVESVIFQGKRLQQKRCPICGIGLDERFEGEQGKILDKMSNEIKRNGTTDYLMLRKVSFDGIGYTNEQTFWICALCSERLMNNLREDGVIE